MANSTKDFRVFAELKCKMQNWTFTTKAQAAYSSMTRDNFLGFGCSATTLFKKQFKLNTFAVPESSMIVTDITLEYLTLMYEDGRILITPVWRFWLGANEDERNFMCQKILAINAVTGQLIWEERGHTM